MVAGLRMVLLKFTVFVLVAVFLFWVLWNTMSNSIGGSSSEYHATFTDVSGLRVGDDVRMAGVKVGRVDGLDLVADHLARVTFSLQDAQPIYATTTMVMRYQNLLGQRYLALVDSGPHVDRIASGATIPVVRTSPGFDLTALLNGLQPLFDTMKPAEINQFAANLIGVLQGEGGTVGSLLRQTASLTGYLADRDQVFGQVLDNLTPVLRDLAAHDHDFDTAVGQLTALMRGLAAQRHQIGSAIQGIGDLTSATAGLLSQARAPFGRDIRTLRRTARVLVQQRANLNEAVTRLPLFGGGLARVMQQGSWLAVYLCNLAVVSGNSSTWVGGPGGPYSAACR